MFTLLTIILVTPFLSSVMSLELTLMCVFLLAIIHPPTLTAFSMKSFSSMNLLPLGWSLSILSTVISMLMMALTLLPSKKSPLPTALLVTLMNFTLLMVFTLNSIMGFYLAFEMSLIPIFWMVLGWGSQPERTNASMSLVLYTVTASLPLLLGLLVLQESSMKKLSILMISLTFYPSLSSPLLVSSLCFSAAFLVKLPMFLVHLWLPKAHVEAPATGSMILAAILLKLGGYGLIVFSPLHSHSNFSSYMSAISLMGGALISLLCVRQKDIKVVIAYSSISHMSLVISSVFTQSPWSVKSALLLMLAHGLSSSGLFALAFFPYLKLHSRNLLLAKGSLVTTGSFTLLWFLLCLSNMGGPLTLNLFSEIILISNLVQMSPMTALIVPTIAFLTAAFSLTLYSSLSHSQIPSLISQPSSSNMNLLTLGAHHSLYPFMLMASIHSMW